jgi:hypothetical protein
LYNKLILELLIGTSNSCGGVLKDEFRVAFGRSRSDKIELALWDFDKRFLRGIAEDQLSNYEICQYWFCNSSNTVALAPGAPWDRM